MGDKPAPQKIFFKIGEVAKLVGVQPHVLRYWEEEFPSLRPMKTRGSHRMYRRRDVDLAMLIRRLVHDEGFTIAGARKRLKELDCHRVESAPDPAASREVALRAELLGVRDSLVSLLDEIERISAAEAPVRSVRIDRVSPAAPSMAATSEPVTRTVPRLEKPIPR